MNATGSGVHWRESARRVWRVARWILLALVLLYIIGVMYRIPHAMQVQKDTQTIAHIQAQKLTMNDVDGNRLPPPPDPQQVNATVAGVDINGNGIRDDVELAIFNKYPGKSNIKIRAAELQYAMTEQMFLTDVFDQQTWKAVAETSDRAYLCAARNIPESEIDMQVKWVEHLVRNTPERESAYQKAFEFEVSYGTAPGDACDLNM